MIHRKLQSKSGETLAEVLVALLIVALASMLLAVMMTTSGRIDITARNRDKSFYETLTRAETHDTNEGNGTGSIVITGVGSSDINIDVNTFGGNGLTSYEKATSDAEEGGS